MKIGKHHITPRWGDIVISKHKSFEYQLERDTGHTPFELSLRWSRKTDHAGVQFTFSVYKLFWLNLNIHDHRHWDFDNDCWVNYGNS